MPVDSKFYKKNGYIPMKKVDITKAGNKGDFLSSIYNRKSEESVREKKMQSNQMREMLRNLSYTENKTNAYDLLSGNSNGVLDILGSTDNDKDKDSDTTPKYNYKDVSGKIQSAKNSITAGQALTAAKRKVSEVKRKIAQKAGDPKELQLALSHAQKMEMVARKKKHNLELEEYVKITRDRDAKFDKMEESKKELKNAMIYAEEEKIEQQEDEILEELNETISEFGEETLEALEEAMEVFENMEVMDPHMSEEEFEEMKRKHRAAEEKAILKADMDYIKGMIKHQAQSFNILQSMPASAPVNTSASYSSPLPAVSVDISL